jgi:hypothetical protein
VERLAASGFDVSVDIRDGLRAYRISGQGFQLHVGVGVKGMLLEFTLVGDGNSPELRFQIDTDLYDISDSRQGWFATEIEDEITSFLEALAAGQVRVSRRRGKSAVVFPTGEGYVRVERGRMLTSRREFKRVEDAEAGEQFQSLC